MSTVGALLAFACLSTASAGRGEPGPRGVPLPAQTRGAVPARLWVQVPEQPAAPGIAQTFWVLEVVGPPGLEIDGPRLEDALDGWRKTDEASSWAHDGRDRIEVSWRLVQSKPGVMPLPGVTLRVRSGQSSAWEEASWHEVLQDPRDGPAPVPLPPAPAPPWLQPLLVAAAGLGAALAGMAALLALLAWRTARRSHPSPRERALRLLQPPALPPVDRPAEHFGHLACVLRDYIEQALGVPAGRQTTDELAAELRQRGARADDVEGVRAVLGFCDHVKFAGALATGNAAAQAELARALVVALPRQAGPDALPGEERRPGEGR